MEKRYVNVVIALCLAGVMQHSAAGSSITASSPSWNGTTSTYDYTGSVTFGGSGATSFYIAVPTDYGVVTDISNVNTSDGTISWDYATYFLPGQGQSTDRTQADYNPLQTDNVGVIHWWNTSDTDVEYGTFDYSFTSSVAEYTSVSGAGYGTVGWSDDSSTTFTGVAYVPVVPEPSGFLLLGMGLMALGLRKVRKQRTGKTTGPRIQALNQ